MKVKFLSILLFINTIASSAYAGIIWDNDYYDPHNTGANVSEVQYRTADNFSLYTEDVLRSVQFWGTHWPTGIEPDLESFMAIIYKDDNGTVGDLIESSELALYSKKDTGHDHYYKEGANILEFTMNFIDPITLSIGNYWLSLVSQDNPSTIFLWQESNSHGNEHVSLDYGQNWRLFEPRSEVAFNLSNEFRVSEPSVITVFILCIIALFIRRKFIQKLPLSK